MKFNYINLLAIFIVLTIKAHLLHSLTELETRSKFKTSDFVYDLRNSTPKQGLGGQIYVAGLNQMPALSSQSIAYVLISLKPCALILPHIHPRAAELLYVINASNLQVGFSEENGQTRRTLVNNITTGHVAFVPMGLIHFVMNLDCQTATILSALNNEDFGVTTITNMFNFPTYTLASSFNLTEKQVIMLKAGLPSSPAKGIEKCLKNCGINSDAYFKNLEDEMDKMGSSSQFSNFF
jgi:oxalate decarboxylase/phosphoglucose isomerase-like protein (cupin superfamily)